MEKFTLRKKYLIVILFVLLGIIVLIGLYFGINKFLEYRAEKQVEKINIVLNNGTINRDNCSIIFDFDKNTVKKNIFFDEKKYGYMRIKCDEQFNISTIEINEDNCRNLIKENKSFFAVDYLVLDQFDKKREICISEYLKVKFSTGTLFNVENDFKSEVKLDFSLDFYSDIGDENSEEYMNNRIEAKKRLKDLIVIEPAINYSVDDIYLSTTKGILRLPLLPLTKYTISIKDFDTVLGQKTQNEKFTFTTPENKYFGMKIIDQVTLYQNNKPPKFQILEYNSGKTKTKIKICKIPDETYAKIEVYRKKAESMNVKNFFRKEIDNLEKINCTEKDILLNTSTDNKGTLVKKDFNFDEILGTVKSSGLYFAEFSDVVDREYNGKFNYPIFFGVVDSHITMKVSQNGEAFIFVNDFEGNPLPKQEINLYLNNFIEKEQNWNEKKSDYDTKYFSVLDKKVFGESINLGLTGNDGILKVNLKNKVEDAFWRTFNQSWDYDWQGLYKTFFVTSTSDKNLSYLSSTWNAGIAPWNFGYSINDYSYWEDISAVSQDQDKITLEPYGMVEPDYYSHVYTDRMLYLPGEIVNIKGVIRKSKDLAIPENKELEIKISDSNGKEILSKKIKINQFGSISDNVKLPESSPLGYYSINLIIDGNIIGTTTFSVEVFKNPKFKNDVVLETDGLNEGVVKIQKQELLKHNYWDENIYTGNFKIKGKVNSKYYNGAKVTDANFTYKVYKQYYYDNSYWEGCYYGCYWEAEKEFYSEGTGILDINGVGNFDISIDFSSNYDDYKYIVEVTVTDSVGDTISGSNSIIAKLPKEYKSYNRELSIKFSSVEKFVKSGEKIELNGGLNPGKWTSNYNDKYLFVIKKKEYTTVNVDDIRGTIRPITRVSEKLEKVMLVNDKNFSMTLDGNLRLNYQLDDVGEYVFEYGLINNDKKVDIGKIIEDFNKEKITNKVVNVKNDIEVCNVPSENFGTGKIINSSRIDNCKIVNITTNEDIKLSDLYTNKLYFTVLTYGLKDGDNPVLDDNKIKVVPEKISYHLGDKAKILVRLPFSKGKILWTIEKQGVLKSEYIDINSNVFFKEVNVDDTFIPNAYIGVEAIEIDGNKVPEYKIGYSEIVVDKTDKKSFITIKSDKKTYQPRDKVILDLKVEDKDHKSNQSELTVMVVDDSLISLLGNIDTNSLEKFYKKLPFQIQTSITNIAMLKNYYFSRPGIVGGSGFGNFKGGDSAVSSRNIFKNTAYYNPSVITDVNGKARVSFNLPDNLTNFRIMVVSNSKNNLFGYSEDNIEVRKNVIIEDKTPLILRDGDISSIGANVFNNTDKDIGFKVELTSNIKVKDPIKNIIIKAGESVNTIWEVIANSNDEEIKYSISALGDSSVNSDKIENTIKIKQSPDLINSVIKTATVEVGKKVDLLLNIPENTSVDKSKLLVSVSNNKLGGIEKIVSSLAQYPYGCIEQTTSSTLPNAILKKFDNLFNGIVEDKKIIDTNLKYGVERIKLMQIADGGFAYWEGAAESDLHITPYVVRSLIDIRDYGTKLPDGLLDNSIKYLENNYNNSDIGDLEKAEIYWTLAKVGKKINIDIDMKNADRHTILAYTYGLILNNKGKINSEIERNINTIKTKLNNSEYYARYRDDISDKATFVSLLMDSDYSRDYIDTLIGELYEYDWSSYYYSTQSKNNAFMAFAKYIEKYSKANNSKFSFSIGSKISQKGIEVGGKKSNIFKQTYKLSDLLENSKGVAFSLTNISGSRLYVDVTLSSFPEDKTKIKAYSNGIGVKREYYEVIDENDITEKCDWKDDKYECVQPKGFKLADGKEFKKGVLYKSKITVDLKDAKNKTNLVVEDFLAGSFRIINSKFNTEQISVRQNQTNWTWNHTEFNPDVVMANATYIWDGSSSFEYYFRPEFEGKFTLPPVVAYFMYNPIIRANTEFREIRVK